MDKWVSIWGNAVSVAENRPERYARDTTICYPIRIPFSAKAVKLTFDNYCGTEPITLDKTTVFYGNSITAQNRPDERSMRCFREGLSRTADLIDGCIDFDRALRDPTPTASPRNSTPETIYTPAPPAISGWRRKSPGTSCCERSTYDR